MIELRELTRIYAVGDQEVRALDGVSLRVGAGEYVAIMGPSGSGKSTLLHLLGLLDRPTSGTYLLGGADVTDLGDQERALARRDRIGFVFQFFHLVERLTAEQNVELPLVLAGLPPGERRPRVRAALESMGLADRLDHRPSQLSGGQRQRVAIARATVTRPSILLADEPTGNLDRASGREVLQILEGLQAEGLTLLVVTHDPEIGERAGRRIRMVDGRVAQDTAGGAAP
ncbi:MAG: ABC transporter ATP-binding protein [Thermodesulfobacteriota bacterium]